MRDTSAKRNKHSLNNKCIILYTKILILILLNEFDLSLIHLF